MLEFGFNAQDLYNREGLIKLDSHFISYLKEGNIELANRLVTLRKEKSNVAEKEISNFLIDLAPYLEDFLGKLFSIEKEIKDLAQKHNDLANIYSCKRLFVQRQAIKKYNELQVKEFDIAKIISDLENKLGGKITEKLFADKVNYWLENKEQYLDEIELATKYTCFAVNSYEGQHLHKKGVLFKLPRKLDFFNLVEVETEIVDGITVIKLQDDHLRYRDGFKLTDKGGSLLQVLDDANYCIYCHNQGKDSCSKGLKEKDGAFKKTALNISQAGCPLEEKISEMNTLKAQGISLGALAMVAIDNPLCAATGHRICNDCMKGCIYQKQEPVNIPRNETRVLQDVLDLPYGFEIYSLLTRWNPLNLDRPIVKAATNYKILVVGLGPAGFNLSHHLLSEGHTVVAIDGLKIEPLPSNISGVDNEGNRTEFKLIKNIGEIFEELDERVLSGFGGVAEYGITVRWNKNYLKVIRLLLERRNNFAMYGGIRFGSTITYDNAINYGFDHIALCMGAGRPTVINMPNALARGVRTASDFLMALQLTGAAKKDSIANLTLRLPVLVIGGGLTAIDTATESLAYYPIQVEKFLSRYEVLVAKTSIEQVRKNWSEEEAVIAEEFISHAKIIRAEREKARQEGRNPDIIAILKQLGGVKVVYRQRLVDAPAYRLNHEEVELAMQEGIEFCENLQPVSVEIDDKNYAKGLKLIAKIKNPNGEGFIEEERFLPARSIFIAAGTNPNTVLNREDPLHFHLDGKYFRAVDEDGNIVKPEANTSKPKQIHVLLHKSENNKYVSYFGDLHPSFVGNVVKAMGAAKQGYPIINKVLSKAEACSKLNSKEFIEKMNEELIAKVYKIERLTPNIVEITVKASAAARNFNPGQFYRLQNFESNAIKVKDKNGYRTTLAMEGLALTGASVDKEKGLLSTIVLEMGGSSNLCMSLKPQEPVVLMGPTGAPTHITSGETVMLVGGGLGNAVLFSIGKALRDNGSKVLYFAGYKKAQDRYKVKEIEAAADIIIWACDEAVFTPERKQDRAFHGNIVEAINAYANGMLGKIDIRLQDVDRVIAIGSDRMMAAVQKARFGILKEYLNPKHLAIGSINSPMQCMMKEVCAQCLQRHVDPKTGEEKYVYSCFNQDQNLDEVDFSHLNERLKQNTLQEKLTAQWINYCLANI